VKPDYRVQRTDYGARMGLKRGAGNRGDEQRARRSHAPTRERSSREAARFARSADLAEFGVQITEYR
jgi:hypothetical protein